MRRLIQLSKHLATELALGSFAMISSALLAACGAFPEAVAIGFMGPVVIALAMRTMWHAGTLRLAWRCPRVDALGLPLPHDEVGMRAAEAGESVLATLDGEARAYRDFFPDARRDVRAALGRALARGTPPEEIERLTCTLREIELRLRKVLQLRRVPEQLATLEQLEQRSLALASAIDELAPTHDPRNVIPIRNGGRS